MTKGMNGERERRPRGGAEQLQRALDAQRLALAGLGQGEDRTRRAEAIDRLAQYISLLRQATGESRFYTFKLEFPDGRWDVEERRLEHPPSVGDVVELERFGAWRVRGSQFVRPRPSQKPPRELFVCAPAA